MCGATLSFKKNMCPNCNVAGIAVDLNKPCRDKPGKQYNPFSTDINTNPTYVQPGQRLAQSVKKEKRKKNELPKIPNVKNVFVSDDIKQCPDVAKERKKSLIVDKIDVIKSCDDLEIDG